MSAIQSFLTCRRRYYYEYVLGIVPNVARPAMAEGTAVHELLQAGYAGYNETRGADFLERARAHFETMEGVDERLYDVVAYYWEHVGQNDQFDEILVNDVPLQTRLFGWSIRCTMDLLARRQGRLVLIDHKTTGQSPAQAMGFLELDFQVRMYTETVKQAFSEPVDVLYNMIRRDVPRELTKTGRKSTASKDVADYLQRREIHFSDRQQAGFVEELRTILWQLTEAYRGDVWYRSPSKGPMGCGSCAYRSVCEGELAGTSLRVDSLPVRLAFRVKENPNAKA